MSRKGHGSEWLARDNSKSDRITIKHEIASHVAEQVSWVSLPLLSHQAPLPNKYLALSACVSPQTIHFQVLGKSPVLGPGRGPLSCNTSSEYLGLISFRIDWLALLAVQGTLKSLLQHHNSKASVLRHSVFFMVQFSHLYMITAKTLALTIWTIVDNTELHNWNLVREQISNGSHFFKRVNMWGDAYAFFKAIKIF